MALKPIPTQSCNLIWMNENEFISAGQGSTFYDTSDSDEERENDDNKNKRNGIFIYNIKSNEWRLLIQYPDSFKSDHHGMCYNSNTNTVYLYGWQDNMIKINLTTKEFTIMNAKFVEHCMKPVLLCINNKCHVIGGSDNKNHFIWDEDNQKFETKFTFPGLNKGIHGHGAIYAPNRNMIYLFGGYDYAAAKYMKKIWKCDVEKDYKWECMMTLPQKIEELYDYAYVLTPDERYIVLFMADHIVMLDLNEDSFYQSEMDGFNAIHGVVCGGRGKEVEILVSGYVRMISNEFGMIVPYELIGIFVQYYCTEDVYLIDAYRKHVKICLNDILSANKSKSSV